jgi:short-subunit dehydrogenase
MSKTIVICGYGTGISAALAHKFAAEGFAVALVARNAEKLQTSVRELQAKGIRAAEFASDLGDASQAPALVKAINEKLGPVTVVEWNAYQAGAGDLNNADAKELSAVLDVAVTGLLAVVQAALPDLRKQPGAAVLVTNGGLGALDPQVDAMAIAWNAAGLAIANAAKHKLVRLLSNKLKGDGIYVGEVMVLSPVKGTLWDDGSAKLEASAIAAKFWEIYSARAPVSTTIG